MKRLIVLATAALVLAACTSTSTSKPGPIAATTSATATALNSSAQSKVSPQAAWCSLALGQMRTAVVAAMGAPNGHKSDQYASQLPQGQTYAEWDLGADVLLATFDASGAAIHLQAYDGDIGPGGAKDITCAPFRNAAS